MQQLRLLFEGYEKAVERMNEEGAEQAPLRQVEQADVDSAWHWIQRREQARDGYRPEFNALITPL